MKIKEIIKDVENSNPDWKHIASICDTKKDYIDFFLANFYVSKYIAEKLYIHFGRR